MVLFSNLVSATCCPQGLLGPQSECGRHSDQTRPGEGMGTCFFLPLSYILVLVPIQELGDLGGV